MIQILPVKYTRSLLDRRSDQDRRQRYNIDVVELLGCDRRDYSTERRTRPEKRSDWLRVTQWTSVCVAELSA
ncbi:MAG: hypothetical protein KKE62_17265 [Proteobacteria bacterium]|nr:hypothetical protein [Pseudomonadota bacterium]MBU1386472.1 hypothetical protein [Pseudomonadota bacterium]MBU1544583.1 hypothetical protein [Pseudomonadota bacterium]MBU2429498.1 hypothetical protein [Pseudomonadota bacterium]MBU2481206.1 hypothetical protein [Pseudomonadota bacterium]